MPSGSCAPSWRPSRAARPLAASGQSSVYQMAGYGVVNLRARYLPRPDTTLDFGVANVGDKWYQLADGLPMPGRTLYMNLGYRF